MLEIDPLVNHPILSFNLNHSFIQFKSFFLIIFAFSFPDLNVELGRFVSYLQNWFELNRINLTY